jgi:hypothetical protein
MRAFMIGRIEPVVIDRLRVLRELGRLLIAGRDGS